MSKPLPPYVVSLSEGQLAGSSQSGATLTISMGIQSPGGWIPPHIHHAEEEAWYVLEGTLTFRFDDKEHEAPSGTFVLVPPGVRHTFANRTDAPARVVNVHAPAGFDRRIGG